MTSDQTSSLPVANSQRCGTDANEPATIRPAEIHHPVMPSFSSRPALRMIGRSVRFLRDAWLIAGIALTLFVLVEGIASLLIRIVEIPDLRIHADDYQRAVWASDYFRELRDTRCRWEPYVYWRHRPFSGKYIQVDEKGLRHTSPAQNGSAQAARPYRVFMFGGSTLWGTGARDEYTIPSLVASELQKEGVAAEVVNFGQSGYVSTQEVIELLRQLQRGNVPQLVVFYDGVNDTYSSYQQGTAGIPQNEFNRVKEFRPSAHALLMQAIGELSTSRLMRKIVKRPGPETDPERVEQEDLPGAVAEVYLSNLRLVESWSRSLGFHTLFYWQPTIFGKRMLSSYERAEREKQQAVEGFFHETCRAVEKRRREIGADAILNDLSGIFADVSTPVYIDSCHLSEYGNSLVARRMAKDILPLVRRSDNEQPETASGE